MSHIEIYITTGTEKMLSFELRHACESVEATGGVHCKEGMERADLDGMSDSLGVEETLWR